MKIPIALVYYHKHGTDIIPVLVEKDEPLPEITNDLLEDLGVDNPELDTDLLEYAEWYTLGPTDHWPKVNSKGVIRA